MCAKKVPKCGLGEEKPKSRLRWLYLPFMLLLGLGSLVLATQRIAAFYGYQTALGQPWGMAFDLPWYAPWSAFAWQSRFHDRIIRNDEAYQRISDYIVNNPSNWKDDKFYTA